MYQSQREKLTKKMSPTRMEINRSISDYTGSGGEREQESNCF
jgi:hypothetical protein